jgi:hypothetical protein
MEVQAKKVPELIAELAWADVMRHPRPALEGRPELLWTVDCGLWDFSLSLPLSSFTLPIQSLVLESLYQLCPCQSPQVRGQSQRDKK